MTFSSDLPPAAPSLGEVIIERTFAKPVHALIDGEMLDALVHDTGTPAPVAPADPPPSASGPTIDVLA